MSRLLFLSLAAMAVACVGPSRSASRSAADENRDVVAPPPEQQRNPNPRF